MDAPEIRVFRLGIALLKRTVRIVSDGSFQPKTKIDTYEVRIEDENQANQIIVTQYVPGSLNDNDAYRAEATGFWAGLSLLKGTARSQKGKLW